MADLPATVAIAGASGLIGSELVQALAREHVRVLRLVRRREQAGEPDTIYWNAEGGRVDAEKLQGVRAIVNLAGESIAEGRWTAARKERILSSRVEGTRLLVETVLAQPEPPAVFVNASAVGFYGAETPNPVDEGASKGSGFLADVCAAWEAETAPLQSTRTRTVLMRFGVVLSRHGGALKKMLPAFRAGLGGKLGEGTQPFSWISLQDAISAILLALRNESVAGPVNVVAPQLLSNEEWTKELGKALSRPTFLRVPAFAMRALFGELADEALLGGPAAVPGVLQRCGFEWRDPEVAGFLEREFQTP